MKASDVYEFALDVSLLGLSLFVIGMRVVFHIPVPKRIVEMLP